MLTTYIASSLLLPMLTCIDNGKDYGEQTRERGQDKPIKCGSVMLTINIASSLLLPMLTYIDNDQEYGEQTRDRT